jgi:hypothetical protein
VAWLGSVPYRTTRGDPVSVAFGLTPTDAQKGRKARGQNRAKILGADNIEIWREFVTSLPYSVQ